MTSTSFRPSPAPAAPRPRDGRLQRAVVAVSAASARRPVLTITGWLLGVAALVVLGALTGTRVLTSAESGTGASGQADRRLAAAGLAPPAGEAILVRSSQAGRTSSVVADLSTRLSALPEVSAVSGPPQVPQLATDGGRTQLIQVTLRGAPDDAATTVAGVSRVVARASAAHPGVSLAQAGDGSTERAVDDVLTSDLHRAELVSLPLTLVVLLLVFGSVVAAAVPLLFGLTSVAAALGALGVISQVLPVSESASTLLVLIGLAVGVDYSLFLVRRERAERRAGRAPEAALATAVAATTRAIVVAGATVGIALAGLALTGMALYASLAVGTVVVVAIAVVGSVTVLPATLSVLGDRLDAGRLRRPRWASRSARRAAPAQAARPPFWGRLAGPVTRHPVASLVTAIALLSAIAAPALDLRTGEPGIDDMPASVPVVAAAHEISGAFPSSSGTALLVVEGSGLGTPAARSALAELGERAASRTGGSSGGAAGDALRVSADQRTAVIEVAVPSSGPGGGERDAAVVTALRAATGDGGPVPGLAALPGARVLVTGDAAWEVDDSERLAARTPLVIAAVLALAFVLLLLSFGSAPLALAVSALNLLSVAAAYGVLAAVFQHSWAASVLGFTATGALVPWVPLFAFVLLFGLSMDYTVLVLERVREARGSGLDPRAAAALGVGATGGTVTAAALVMVSVFALFAGLRLVEFKEVGVGLAAAVALDATLVRGVALPAALTLLGRRGWRVAVSR